MDRIVSVSYGYIRRIENRLKYWTRVMKVPINFLVSVYINFLCPIYVSIFHLYIMNDRISKSPGYLQSLKLSIEINFFFQLHTKKVDNNHSF